MGEVIEEDMEDEEITLLTINIQRWCHQYLRTLCALPERILDHLVRDDRDVMGARDR
jgi:hypothetical protein